jgi:hypothetical protein
LIKPEVLPKAIIGSNYNTIYQVLENYQKSAIPNWDTFAKTIGVKTRETMSKVLAECRRNGFFNPSIREGKICFQQLVEGIKPSPINYDLCSLCERNCSRKNDDGVFKKGFKGDEVKKCWEEVGRG